MDKDIELKLDNLRLKYKERPELRGVILKQVQLLKVAQDIRNKRRGNVQQTLS